MQEKSIVIKEYIISNYEHLKNIVEEKKLKRDEIIRIEAKELEDEINEQYEREVNFAIIEEVTKTLAVDYESVYSVLEMKHIRELFR